MSDFSLRIPTYLAEYLQERLSVPVIVGMGAQETERPFVSVYCGGIETTNHTWASDISIRLNSEVDRSLEEDSIIVEKIRNSLKDTTSFDLFMWSKPHSYRVGWNPQRWEITAYSGEITDPDGGLRTFEFLFRAAIITS